MKFCYKKVALLVLTFCILTAYADHHTHDHNHHHSGDNHSAHNDILATYDHRYHEYHHHHPVEQPNCGQVCPKSLPRINYGIGKVLLIDMDGQIEVNVKDVQTIGLKSKVEIHVLTACELALKLRDSKIDGVPNPSQLEQQLDNSPVLRFGAHDHKILGICPTPEEELWTLNIKKAILSAMQVTTKDFSTINTVEEVDFSGHCTTIYRPMSEVSADGKDFLLQKTKNLNKCHLRRKNISGFQSKSLLLLTEYLRENLPILQSTQRCTQEFKNGHLINVACVEEQRLSFQDESVVKSTLNLKFIGPDSAGKLVSADPSPPTAQSLLMSRDNDGQKVALESDVLALLNTMCAQVSADRMSSEVTESFHALVTALRTLPEAGTRTMYKAVKSGEICQSPKLRDLFLAASGMAATDASIETIITAFNNKEMSNTQLTLLLSLVALKSRPSEKTIDSLVALVQSKESARPLVLGISMMVRNYCKKLENCEQIPAVKKTIDALLQRLQTTDCNLERITAIKALDNIRPKNDQAAKDALLALAQDSASDAGVRIAAIQAIQRCCKDEAVSQKLVQVLFKNTDPSEVRIAAYKAVIASGASSALLESIKSESDPQIQNYIRSHIKNLKQSSNQNRRNLLPPNAPEFDEPRSIGLGTTRNSEYNYKEAVIETDVIYPKSSMIPSLVGFSVWLPFGEKDYQLIEVQVRHQGLDEHLKKIISKGIAGPEILMQLSLQLLELIEHLKEANHKHDIIIQVSVRMSGKNILFIDTFEDLHSLVDLIRTKLKKAYNLEKIDVARAFTLLDSQVEVPSLNGFPMLVHLNDTIVLGMTADHSWSESGGSRLRKIKSSRTYLEELSAGINVKIGKYRPGFEYHARFELARNSDYQAEKIDGRILKMKINLPNDRQSIIKLSQSIRLIDGNGETRESNEISGRSTDDTVTRCHQMFGLQICRSRTWLHNSPIPNVEYYFTKEDPTLETLELTLEKPAATDPNDLRVYTARVNAGKREYQAQLELKLPRDGPKKIQVKLVSPRRTITADANMATTADGNKTDIEVDVKIPELINVKTTYNAEKTGDYSRNIDILTEYQLSGVNRRDTIRWTRKSSLDYKKNKKSKQINVSYFGEFQSSQFPHINSKVTYYTNFRPYQNSKTDLTVEWGAEYKDRVRLQHNSKMDVIELRPFQMVAENAFIVEATPLDINYDVKLNSDISMIKTKPRLVTLNLVGRDVSGRSDRNIDGNFRYERMEQPLQQFINASLLYPGYDYTYYSEIKEVKDLSYEGKVIWSPQKGKVVTIEHKQSISNPTKDFLFELSGEASYSWKPDKMSFESKVGWHNPEKFVLAVLYKQDDVKHHELMLDLEKKSAGWSLAGRSACTVHDSATDFKVDNVLNPRSAQWSIKVGPKSYKFSAIRVPKESVAIKLDSAENSRVKELKVKVSRKEKSTLKLVTNDDLSIEGFIDPIARDTKRGHLEVNYPKHQYSHIGDITYNRAERKLIWTSKTSKAGAPYITVDSQFAARDKTYFIAKKIKGPDAVSKLEFFCDKGVYALTLDTSRYTAILEGENRNNKQFGKLGFVDKIDNYEHKSHFNVSNGILTIKSISDQEKQTFSKLDAVIGCKIISNLSLVSPNRNAKLTINPLGEKKTLLFEYVSNRYTQHSNAEWVPRKYLKFDSVTERKVDPKKLVKLNGYLTRYDESSIRYTAPAFDVDIRRVKTPKPKFIFNTTMNGYNEVQEFDSNPNLPPLSNFMIALSKFLNSYTSG